MGIYELSWLIMITIFFTFEILILKKIVYYKFMLKSLIMSYWD